MHILGLKFQPFWRFKNKYNLGHSLPQTLFIYLFFSGRKIQDAIPLPDAECFHLQTHLQTLLEIFIYVEGKQSDLRGEITRRRNTSDKLIEKLPIVSSIILNYYHARVSLQETIQTLQINKHIPVLCFSYYDLCKYLILQYSYRTYGVYNTFRLWHLHAYPYNDGILSSIIFSTCSLAGRSLDLRGATQNQSGDRKSSGLVIVIFSSFNMLQKFQHLNAYP